MVAEIIEKKAEAWLKFDATNRRSLRRNDESSFDA